MTVLGVIPARWKSSRFPGKPLANILGMPMFVHTCEQARRARRIDQVVLATDDERIAEVCAHHGIDYEMTSPDHETGTDRLAEVAWRRGADIYVNIQGDEPLISPDAIDAVVGRLRQASEGGTFVSTAYIPGTTAEQEASASVVHLVPTLDGHVLTLSRLPVPAEFREKPTRTVHVGLYAFTGKALRAFSDWSQGPVERSESIELMRFLEHGWRIACTPVPPGSIGVDHPEDIMKVEAILRKRMSDR